MYNNLPNKLFLKNICAIQLNRKLMYVKCEIQLLLADTSDKRSSHLVH